MIGTQIQMRVLCYLATHLIVEQRQPTMKEVAHHFGWASPNAAETHVVALAKKGYIDLGAGRKQRLKVLKAA